MSRKLLSKIRNARLKEEMEIDVGGFAKKNWHKKSFLPHMNDLLITGSSRRTKRKTSEIFNKVMARITWVSFFIFIHLFIYFFVLLCSWKIQNLESWKAIKLNRFFFQPGIKTRTVCVLAPFIPHPNLSPLLCHLDKRQQMFGRKKPNPTFRRGSDDSP